MVSVCMSVANPSPRPIKSQSNPVGTFHHLARDSNLGHSRTLIMGGPSSVMDQISAAKRRLEFPASKTLRNISLLKQKDISTLRHGETTLCHGVTTLCHGVTTHRHGVTTLCHGVTTLRHGETTLCHGVTTLFHGVTTLRHGVTTHRHGVTTLCHVSTRKSLKNEGRRRKSARI